MIHTPLHGECVGYKRIAQLHAMMTSNTRSKAIRAKAKLVGSPFCGIKEREILNKVFQSTLDSVLKCNRSVQERRV